MLLNNDEKDTGSTIMESKEDFLAMNEKSPKYLQIEVLEQYDFEYLNDTCPPFPLLTIKVMILHCPIRTMNNCCYYIHHRTTKELALSKNLMNYQYP